MSDARSPLDGHSDYIYYAGKGDKGKVRMSLLLASMAPAVKAVAEVLTFGAEKYSAESWKQVINAEERYTDALYRHLNAIHSGEEVDSESGLLHLSHVACNAMFLLSLHLEKENGQT